MIGLIIDSLACQGKLIDTWLHRKHTGCIYSYQWRSPRLLEQVLRSSLVSGQRQLKKTWRSSIYLYMYLC